MKDDCPARALGIAAALNRNNFHVEEVQDLFAWAATRGRCVLVLGLLDEVEQIDIVSQMRARFRKLSLVTLVADTSVERHRRVLLAGADGVVHQDAQVDNIIEVVRAALEQRTVLPTEVVRALAVGSYNQSITNELSALETSWLQALADGSTVAQLAEAALYSEREMHRHLRRLYAKLGVSTRIRAIIEAVRLGLIQ